MLDSNCPAPGKIAARLAELSKYGLANIRRAYGNWASAGLKGWTAGLHEYTIRPNQQFSYSSGKNASDMALMIDTVELPYTQRPDAFCIASRDADFTPLVMQLRANGHGVYGFGERKTPEPFVNACTIFLYLDGLADESGTGSQPAARATSAAKPGKRMGDAEEPHEAEPGPMREVTDRSSGWRAARDCLAMGAGRLGSDHQSA